MCVFQLSTEPLDYIDVLPVFSVQRVKAHGENDFLPPRNIRSTEGHKFKWHLWVLMEPADTSWGWAHREGFGVNVKHGWASMSTLTLYRIRTPTNPNPGLWCEIFLPCRLFQTGFDTQTALDSETSNCRRLKRNEEKWVKWRWAVHVSPSVLTDNTCSTSFSFWISIKFNLPHFSLTPVTDDFRAVVHARTFIDVSERTARSSKTERKQDSVCVSNFKLRTSNGCPSLLCM